MPPRSAFQGASEMAPASQISPPESTLGTAQDDIRLNWILFDKSRRKPVVIRIPRNLYEQPSQDCQTLFVKPLFEQYDVVTRAARIKFWTPNAPLSVKVAAEKGWATSIVDVDAHFTPVPNTSPFSRRLTVDDDELIHLVVTVRDQGLAGGQSDVDEVPELKSFSRKRRLVDHSHVVESWQSKRLKKHLPTLEELIGALEEPLVDSEKIPITESMYISLISMLLPDRCNEDTVGTLFKIGEFDLNLLPFLHAAAKPSPVEGTEDSFHSFWDGNIRDLIEFLIPVGKTIRNSNQHTDTRKLRPDYGFLLRKICTFRGEEKGPDNYEDPKAELADKLNWVYDPAPYMLGYYCRGSEMTLVAITAPDSQGSKPNVHDLIKVDLRWRKDRIANIRHLINLSPILPRLTDLVRFPVDDFELFVRTNSTVEITSTLVIKTYTCENPEAKVGFLRRIYAMIAERHIPNTDTLVFTNKNVAHLSPRGIAGEPKVEKELRECVICILESLIAAHRVPIFHRDIRWNNVIRRIEDHSKWFLIDWEDAARPPTKAQLSFARSSHSPAIFEDGHGADVDIWGVGHLIKTCQAPDVSLELKALGDRMCNESQSLSAEEALKLVKPTQT